MTTERQKRARKGLSCIFTGPKPSCAPANLITIEGIALMLCPFHRHNLLKIVAQAKAKKASFASHGLEAAA